jgi:MGT family glycosyltransferase
MARILISPMPFSGHVAPLLAVAEQLVRAGHDVRVYTGAAFRDAVERAGARLVPWTKAPDFDENDLPATFPRLRGRKGLWQVFVNLTEVMIDTAPAQVADLSEEWDREPWDVQAADETSVGAALFAEHSGCPHVTVAVLPLNLSGTSGPPSGLGLTPGTTALTRSRDATLRSLVPVLASPLRGPLARARRAVGLPASSLTFEKAVFSTRLIAASGCRSLDFQRRDRPAHVHFVGRLAGSPPPAVLPAWWSDLDGRQVVHVSQGTQNIDPADLIRPTLDALADDDALVVVSTGVPGRDELPFPVPDNTRVAGFLPYAQLLPRVDLMVTNGGWGGTLAALGHGIPLVIAGGDLDKPEVAARVAWAGAGVNLRTGTPRADAVRAAVWQVRGDPAYRAAARAVAAELASLGGAARAAELIAGLA